MKKFFSIFFLIMMSHFFVGCGNSETKVGPWTLAEVDGLKGRDLTISYSKENLSSQYGVLHLYSSYLRLIYGKEAAWGTSVILFPSFWVAGIYYQGVLIEDIEWTAEEKDGNLILHLTGSIQGLSLTGDVKIYPPQENYIKADVTMNVEGTVALDIRNGEAFKPVMLSSMYVNKTDKGFDCIEAYTNSNTYPMPSGDNVPIIPFPQWKTTGNMLGLKGEHSAWQSDPTHLMTSTVEVTLDNTYDIAGWKSAPEDPSDPCDSDNIGFWAATTIVIPSWSYTIISKKPGTLSPSYKIDETWRI